MNEEVIQFYDKESSYYALKRYEAPMIDFTQFYFRRRLALALRYIQKISKGRKDLSLLEVGCADGVIVRKIDEKFPHLFSAMVGTDISPKMIEEAQKRNTDPKACFFVRGSERENVRYDLIVELGFLIAPILEDELVFVSNRLNANGYYICSLSLKHSLRMMIMGKDGVYAKTHLSISQYEKLLREHFTILKSDCYGLFVPKLWAFPVFARKLQPVLDSLLKYFIPGLFHEKIYLLQSNKSKQEAL